MASTQTAGQRSGGEPPVRHEVALSARQIESFRRDGYLVVEQISYPEELVQLCAMYDELLERRVGRSEGNQFDLAGRDEDDKPASVPQILQFSDYAPELRESVAWRNAGRIMAQLLGAEPDMRRDHAIYKPPQNGAETPWHQDEAYWSPAHEHRSLSVWFALQDVDDMMGCMRFVPGSHRFDVLPHRPIRNDPTIHGLELDDCVDVVRGVVSCRCRRAVARSTASGRCTTRRRTARIAPGAPGS